MKHKGFILKYITLITMIFFIAGCADYLTDSNTKNLNDNKKLWEKRKIENYTFVELISSYAPKRENIWVRVEDNEVLLAKYIPSNTDLTNDDLERVKTIDGYFDLIEDSISKDENVIVRYDHTYGYPVEIDLNLDVEDGSVFYKLSHFIDSTNATCTEEYTPVCGSVNIACITTPCEPIKETFSNNCYLNQNPNASFFSEGEC